MTNSHYNALVLSFQKRLSRGFQFQTGYTWAKSMDVGSGIAGGHVADGTGSNLIDPWDWKRDLSRSDFDVRHTVKINSIVELPFGSGKRFGNNLSGVSNAILGGWQLSGILRFASNSPIDIRGGQTTVANGLDRVEERPNLVAGRDQNPLVKSGTSPICGDGEVLPGICWFDFSAFEAPLPGFLGNLGRNTVQSPNQMTVDFSILKNFPAPQFSEQFRVEFRAEFFNIFNRPNFGPPDGRRIFRSRARRRDAVGIIEETVTSSRQIQLGLKLYW